mgnify:CR=1 FL=1
MPSPVSSLSPSALPTARRRAREHAPPLGLDADGAVEHLLVARLDVLAHLVACAVLEEELRCGTREAEERYRERERERGEDGARDALPLGPDLRRSTRDASLVDIVPLQSLSLSSLDVASFDSGGSVVDHEDGRKSEQELTPRSEAPPEWACLVPLSSMSAPCKALAPVMWLTRGSLLPLSLRTPAFPPSMPGPCSFPRSGPTAGLGTTTHARKAEDAFNAAIGARAIGTKGSAQNRRDREKIEREKRRRASFRRPSPHHRVDLAAVPR